VRNCAYEGLDGFLVGVLPRLLDGVEGCGGEFPKKVVPADAAHGDLGIGAGDLEPA